MVDLRTPSGPSGADERFEFLLRERLHALADHAPATVRSIDEIAVVHANRRRVPRPRRRIAGIGATIGTLAAGLGLTTLALNGAGDPGESTPEAAVTRFVQALEAEDVLGMIDILDPAEVPTARAAVQTGRTEAERVGLVSGGLSLDGVAGVDVEVADLSLSTTRVFDDVAVVRATAGTASISFDPSTFPLGDSISGYFDRSTLGGSAIAELGDDDLPVQIATVERAGRWYVSTSYTIAEYLRTADDRPTPTDIAPLSSVGSPTPEAAAEAWYGDLLAFDLNGAAQLAAPGVGDAVLRYADLWLPGAADDIARLRADGWDLRVDQLTLSASGDGDVRTLTPTAFTISGTTSASIAAQPTLDPTLPTVVYSYDGGFAVVPAGDPLPDTIDSLDIETDYAALDLPAYNSTSADADGVIYPLVLPDELPTGPQSVRAQLADGCVTYSGAAIDALFDTGFPSTSPVERTADGGYRTCEPSFGVIGLVLLPIGQAGGGLPSVTVQQVDGQWYVSPLGTLTDAVLGLLDGVPDGGSLFDSDLGLYVYGTNRASLTSLLTGLTLDALSDACRAIVTDDGSAVTGLVADPDLAQVKRCWNDGFLSADGVTVSGGGVSVESAPASSQVVVATTIAVPETVAP
jgi:hypothetical protein